MCLSIDTRDEVTADEQTLRLESTSSGPAGRVWRRGGMRVRLLLAVAFVVQPHSGMAQGQAVPPAPSAVIHWWHGAAVLGGLSALLLLDQPAQEYLQDHRSPRANDVAAALRHFGQPEVYGTVTL